MDRALDDNDTSDVDELLRANSEAFFFKLDNMEFKMRNATKSLLQDNEKYILCLETPETSLMSALLAKTLRNLKIEGFSNQHQDQIFIDFHNFIKINKKYENWTNFPDLLVCKLGIDEKFEQYSDVLTSWAKLVKEKEKSKKIIFITRDSKYLEQSMMKTRMVYVLKLKFTELWKENERSNCHGNKQIMNDESNNADSKGENKAIQYKANDKTSEKSVLPNEAEMLKLTSILKLQGLDSMNSVDQEGNTPLHLAAKNGQNKIVKALLVCDARKESKNCNGCTSLHLAVMEGHHEAVTTLLENNANVNASNYDCETPLYMACQKNNVHLIELLLKFGAKIGANIERKDQNGNTHLHLAIEKGYHEVARTLLENNANVNAVNYDNQTSLYMACQKNDVHSIKLLLKFGANTEIKDKYGCTPLHLATRKGYGKVVNTLLENEADVNAVDNDYYNQTPLHTACCMNNVHLIELLLKFGAKIGDNIEKKDQSGNTPLHLAAQYGHHKVVSVLLENNANVNAINSYNETPLHMACRKNNVHSVEFLLKFGANIETKDQNGYTPLHQAAYSGHNTVITALLQHQSNINAQDNSRCTPLHLAIGTNKQEVIVNLLKHGAAINLKNNSNETAIDCARYCWNRGWHTINLVPIIEKHAALAYKK